MSKGYKIEYKVDSFISLFTCKDDKYPCIIYPSDGKITMVYPREYMGYLRIEIKDIQLLLLEKSYSHLVFKSKETLVEIDLGNEAWMEKRDSNGHFIVFPCFYAV